MRNSTRTAGSVANKPPSASDCSPSPFHSALEVKLQKAPSNFTVPEFAAWARIGETSAWKEIAEGRLKARKCGSRTIVPWDSAVEWLNSLPLAK